MNSPVFNLVFLYPIKKSLRKISLLLFFVCINIRLFKESSIGNVSPIGEAVAIFPPIVPTFLI